MAGNSQRTMMVWTAFGAAMTLAGGLLVATDPAPAPPIGTPTPAASAERLPASGRSVFQTTAPLDRDRWQEIVIHDSASPYGSHETLARDHQAAGLRGLGYHFLVGNGNGMGDGDLHVGYRWDQQLPGAHVAGPDADYHNHHAIAICLIGNGDAREFTDAQLERLVRLVVGLQEELGIPAERVRFGRDLGGVGPGRRFPLSWFREQLSLAGAG